MQKIIILLTLFFGAVQWAGAKSDKVHFIEDAVPVSSVKHITGFFGQRMDLNRNVYLKNFPIDWYVDFIVKREHTDWDWTRAEQHGKWIESAYLSAIQGDDKELLNKAQSVLKRIIASQEKDGYVGATAKSYRTPERPVRGMDAYELYFVFHAFITVYEETGDKEALQAAEKLADYYLKYFGPGKLEFWSSDLRAPENKGKVLNGHSEFAGHSVHYSWEGSLLCDPIARLYEVTGKKKYLDWSQWVVDNIDKWSGWDAFSRLDSVADGKLGVDKLQPYVHSHTFHMNFMGFLRLYRITGDTMLLRKVKGAWDDIHKRQMYITGGVSVAEHYEHDYVKPLSGNIVETCATMSWMQLTQELLKLTGDVKYADAIERLMLNHVFAAQDAETGVCRYHTAPNGTKPNGYFHGPDCCTASGHRIISMLPTFLYAQKGDVFYVNQYLPSSYIGKDFSFDVVGNYPEDEEMKLVIKGCNAKNKELNLRIPSWCAAPVVKVNGEPVGDVQPGSYLKLLRKWKEGDEVRISFPMKTQWVLREHHSNYISYRLKDGEIMYKEESTNRIPVAFMRGPVVYCLDMVWNKQLCNDDVDMDKDIRVDTSVVPVKIDKPETDILGPVYQTKALYKGSEVNIVLTPFTNIGKWFRTGEAKPQKNADVFTYGIWLYAVKQAVRVACVGNSITYGSGVKDREQDSYPAVLGRLLGAGYDVRNFGVGGRTLLHNGDRPYIQTEAYREALEFNPNVVILKLGTNDSKAQNWVHQADFTNDLQALVDTFKALPAHPKIYLCYPSKAYHLQGDYINDSIIVRGVIPKIKQVAEKNKLPVIDLHSAMDGKPQLFPDKVHPNEEGARVMAEAVRAALDVPKKDE